MSLCAMQTRLPIIIQKQGDVRFFPFCPYVVAQTGLFNLKSSERIEQV